MDSCFQHWPILDALEIKQDLCTHSIVPCYFWKENSFWSLWWLTYTLKHEILLSLNHDLGLQRCKFYVNLHKMIHPIFIFRLSICLNSSPGHEFCKLFQTKEITSFVSNLLCFNWTENCDSSLLVVATENFPNWIQYSPIPHLKKIFHL